ncbi:MAG: hypothetical protein JNN12_09815 [Bacteroidetes Order II. Incertae sedis bacterium]|nr:hypothetical protein [Bacteroidetes Order II. bacterium]
MNTQRMTIHRGLSELKLLDVRITKTIQNLKPAEVRQKDKLIGGRTPEAEFVQEAKSKFQAIQDLIVRKNKIKCAIVEANSKTMVEVAGRKMTIADAINYKRLVEYQKSLIEAIQNGHRRAVAELNTRNTQVEQNLQHILETTFGKDNVKVGKDDIESIRKPFLEANAYHLVDPLEAEKTIERLEKEVGEFEAEVDAILSEANAVTYIEITV